METVKLGSFDVEFSHRGKFRLFSFQNVFSEDSYAFLQKAFQDVVWEKKETFFYSQFRSILRPGDKTGLTAFFRPDVFFPLKKKLEHHLGVSFQNCTRLHAHKLITADEIGVHNDYAHPELGGENFRLILQFKRPIDAVQGGEISFLHSRDPGMVLKRYAYSVNTGICFEITPDSYHCVSAVEGERYTLVMYLWQEGRHYDGSGFEVMPQ